MEKLLKWIGFTYAVMILCSACGDQDLLELDKIQGIDNWEPDMTVPIAHGEYTLWKLINQGDEDSVLILRGDEILIQYTKDSIYSLDINEIVDISQTEVNENIYVPVNLNEVSGSINVPLPDTLRYTKTDTIAIPFEDGQISRFEGSMNIRYSFPQTSFKYEIECTIVNAKTEGNPIVIPIDFDPGQTYTFPLTISVPDVVFEMENDRNKLHYELKFYIPANEIVDNDADLELILKIDNLDFTRIEGLIERDTFDIKRDEFNLDLNFWNSFQGAMYFNDPKFFIHMTNYGLDSDVQLEMDMVAYNSEVLPVAFVQGEPMVFNGWDDSQTKPIYEQKYFDRNNSNLDELISLPPKDSIVYWGKVISNPLNQDVVVLKNAKVDVGMNIEIPLDVKLTDVIFRDTIDLDGDDLDMIKEAYMQVFAENEIPLELTSGNFYLMNEEYVVLDSIQINGFMDAPVVNSQGEVIRKAESQHKIPLSKENINNLKDTKYMVLSVQTSTARTESGAQVSAKLKPEAGLKLRILLGAKLDMEEI